MVFQEYSKIIIKKFDVYSFRKFDIITCKQVKCVYYDDDGKNPSSNSSFAIFYGYNSSEFNDSFHLYDLNCDVWYSRIFLGMVKISVLAVQWIHWLTCKWLNARSWLSREELDLWIRYFGNYNTKLFHIIDCCTLNKNYYFSFVI